MLPEALCASNYIGLLAISCAASLDMDRCPKHEQSTHELTGRANAAMDETNACGRYPTGHGSKVGAATDGATKIHATK